MFLIEGKANLPANVGKARPQLQQELLQMVNDPRFKIRFGVLRQLRQPQKFQHIWVFDSVLRGFHSLPLKSQAINLILIRTEGKALIQGTVILPFQF